MSRLFASGGQRIGVSASVLPMNIHDGFPLRCTGLISFGDFTEDYGLGNSLSESLSVPKRHGRGQDVYEVLQKQTNLKRM